ncbi:MAG: hypothetical protein JW928_02445 [Candidatus Aureabacteria bacterium]|nr:hypothetical protein [Candidatus Auribacterota bacterium]
MESDFLSTVKKIVIQDRRFQEEAYTFVMEGLYFYTEKHKLKTGQHVTGAQLLDGIREYALLSFGPMTKFTLNSWGIKNTKDVGLIVYNMIDAGLMGKTDSDSVEDFFDVYDFDDVFSETRFSEDSEE